MTKYTKDMNNMLYIYTAIVLPCWKTLYALLLELQ